MEELFSIMFYVSSFCFLFCGFVVSVGISKGCSLKDFVPFVLGTIIFLSVAVATYFLNDNVYQKVEQSLIYEAELKSGEVVKARDCEMNDEKKYCEVRENEVKSGFFVSSEFIKVVVNDYREVE